MSITISDLKNVYTITFEARHKWRNILLSLDVSAATIESIGTKWHDNVDDCYREGLSEWLKGGHTERSWRELQEALSSPIVGFSNIARVIERDYLMPANTSKSPIDGYISTDPFAKIINESLMIFSNKNIGSGAFGVVFKGSYKNTPCAVKVLHQVAIHIQTSLPAGPANNKVIEAFEKECDFLKAFHHPNVVQHLSTVKHPVSGNTILVTELMDCNLRSYLSGVSEESITVYCQVSLSKDVASGLAYLHSRQIIHRDLCGDNILLSLGQPVPVAKISDFGMSRLLDNSQISSTLTAVGHRMGYLPPEALTLENEKYDHSLDVFSLGVIMVQIVCKVETVKSVKDRSFLVSQIPTTHKLKLIINDCLQENMRMRPESKDICSILEATKLTSREEIDVMDIQDKTRVEPKPTFFLKWKQESNMLFEMSGGVQSVVIKEGVFVGGGKARNHHDECTVMRLDLQQYQWTTLPQYSARYFAMAALKDQLALIGGYNLVSLKLTNMISVFDSGKWTHPYPSMNIARCSSTAVYFSSHIIVAGGYDKQGLASSVEVLDVESRSWHFVNPLPNPRAELKSTQIGDMFYLMGGLDQTGETKVVFAANVTVLIESKQATPTPWQAIGTTPLEQSSPLNADGSLFAVGGHDDYNSRSFIFRYMNDTMRWVKVGNLPSVRYNCTCLLLPMGDVLVAGGQTAVGEYTCTVDVLSIVSIN